MAASDEIRGLISLYLGNSVSLPEFAGSFASIFYDIEDSNDKDAIQFSYKVESILARASEGFLSREELISSLAGCLSGVSVFVSVDIQKDYRHRVRIARISKAKKKADLSSPEIHSKFSIA